MEQENKTKEVTFCRAFEAYKDAVTSFRREFLGFPSVWKEILNWTFVDIHFDSIEITNCASQNYTKELSKEIKKIMMEQIDKFVTLNMRKDAVLAFLDEIYKVPCAVKGQNYAQFRGLWFETKDKHLLVNAEYHVVLTQGTVRYLEGLLEEKRQKEMP